MKENVKGVIAYFGWIGGLIVLFGLHNNSKETEFNACQSIVISLISTVISLVFGFIPVIKYLAGLLGILAFVLLVIGMIKAYNNEKYEIPVISDLTRDLFKNRLGE